MPGFIQTSPCSHMVPEAEYASSEYATCLISCGLTTGLSMQGAEAGALDDVINDVIPIIETELFGQVSEEKEANAFVGGCKEAKRLRAYATYQLLAHGVTFRDHMSTLLQPVRPHPKFMHCIAHCAEERGESLKVHALGCGPRWHEALSNPCGWRTVQQPAASAPVATQHVCPVKNGVRLRDSGLLHMGMQVVGRLPEASSPKVRAKLQQLLQAAVQGVLANDSVSPSDLLLFIHGVLEAGIAAEEAAQAAAQAAAEAPGGASVSDTPSLIPQTAPGPPNHGLDWLDRPDSTPCICGATA